MVQESRILQHANIREDTSTPEMAEHLRRWADCEQRYGATHRAKQWRIVADRLDALEEMPIGSRQSRLAGDSDTESKDERDS